MESILPYTQKEIVYKHGGFHQSTVTSVRPPEELASDQAGGSEFWMCTGCMPMPVRMWWPQTRSLCCHGMRAQCLQDTLQQAQEHLQPYHRNHQMDARFMHKNICPPKARLVKHSTNMTTHHTEDWVVRTGRDGNF